MQPSATSTVTIRNVGAIIVNQTAAWSVFFDPCTIPVLLGVLVCFLQVHVIV